jgi:hypothetical protein
MDPALYCSPQLGVVIERLSLSLSLSRARAGLWACWFCRSLRDNKTDPREWLNNPETTEAGNPRTLSWELSIGVRFHERFENRSEIEALITWRLRRPF